MAWQKWEKILNDFYNYYLLNYVCVIFLLNEVKTLYETCGLK
jgi:hypothetical protein